MSESLRRRSSSRQLLQNLIRVTEQRSQEDAEEVERERRRRARERQRGEGSPSSPEPPQHSDPTHSTGFDEELKPSSFLVLEEDEGFSDWSHRLENRHEQEVQNKCRGRDSKPSAPQWKPELKEEGGQEAEQRSLSQEPSTRPPEKTPTIPKEVRTSYSSSVFLPQDSRLQHATGQPADRTSYLVAGTLRPRGGACRVDGEVEQMDEEVVQEQQQQQQQPPRTMKDDEELRSSREEKEEFHLSRERDREEVEEKHKTPDKIFAESGGETTEEVNRRPAAPICSSSEGEEPVTCYGPMSPTFKKLLIQFYPDEVNSRVSTDGKCTIIERTESLRKSTNSIKKTPPPVAVCKINEKLEQYTHALEVSSKDGRSGCQMVTDLTNPPEPVAFKKNLFEAREAWNQNALYSTTSKDADCSKVGVADLINQWVRGSEDGSRCSSPCKPAQESSTGKRYKFVVTGHGKYEKVPVDNSCSEDSNCQSAELTYENL
ncbi:hypothetical protein Q5P01_006924 [Channa striata]|uniref:Lymphocyte-specific protein 1 n=1 Tax=Channa striata TaxID=64152 RepID=A0AA88NE12_CHASR|nr:hypothetical protein Q5P01_006924 [Channa striata]